jgi:hypothetical protein
MSNQKVTQPVALGRQDVGWFHCLEFLRSKNSERRKNGMDAVFSPAQGIEAEIPEAPGRDLPGAEELECIARFFAAQPQKMRPKT